MEYDIAERVAYFRNKRNLSARELSLMLGKNSSYISKLEANAFVISTPALYEILNVLQVSPQEFFATNYHTYSINVELINLIEKLPIEKREYLIKFLK